MLRRVTVFPPAGRGRFATAHRHPHDVPPGNPLLIRLGGPVFDLRRDRGVLGPRPAAHLEPVARCSPASTVARRPPRTPAGEAFGRLASDLRKRFRQLAARSLLQVRPGLPEKARSARIGGVQCDDDRMPWWLDLLIALAGGVVLAWVALLVLLAVSRPRGAGAGELLAETSRLLPDVVRLVGRLAADRSLPRGVRVRLVALAAYLASPLDLIPDVIPVLGVLDDAILVAWLLRSVVRRAGPDALTRHWPGSPAGLAAIRRLAGLGRE